MFCLLISYNCNRDKPPSDFLIVLQAQTVFLFPNHLKLDEQFSDFLIILNGTNYVYIRIS